MRSFCSGNGTRGKNISLNVKAEDMNDNLTIPVEDETPIEFDILLQQSLSTDVSNISKEVVDDKIDFDSILISQDVWDKCTEIVDKLGDKEWKPYIIALKDNQYALYEGGDVSGFPVGGWFTRKALATMN
ncbi:hypothetical protein [Pseudobacteroides sp.]|uniref:hypothetical protein n=1 Tax=Pseudobacteroides sp. TaxID=1968840 RepID=UPI002F94BF36